MRHLILTTMIVACASGAVAAPVIKAATKLAAAKPAKASVFYDFKGARLGMSLQEIKALPAPTMPPYSSPPSQGQYGPERLFCSGDTYSDGKQVEGFYVGKGEEALGVVECKYGREWQITKGHMALDASRLGIGNRATSDVAYRFMGGRLFSIRIGGHRNLLSETLGGLTEKFGRPDTVVNDTIQNKAGETFPRTEHLWSNPAATITVRSPHTKIDNLNVTYMATDAAERISAKKSELSLAASEM